jgi:membrane protease YdiL (CAAX protease family)
MFDLTKRHQFLSVALLFEGGLVGVAGAIGWWFEVDPFGKLEWNLQGIAWGAAAALPMFGLFLLANWLPFGPLRRIKQFLHEALGPSLLACRWYDLLLVAAVAGLGEEVLFRGVLHPLTGLLWSNVLFGFVHFITPTYAVLAGFMGAYLGRLLQLSENLLAPIMTHGLYDFLAFLVVARECRKER